MGPNQTKFISMGPIWNTSGTETVISVPVSVLGPERAGTEMGCIQPKQIKRIMTCVSLNGLSEFNTQYFFMGMVQFESQEYTLQGRMQFFAKSDKIRLF